MSERPPSARSGVRRRRPSLAPREGAHDDAPPLELRANELDVGGAVLVVFSYPVAPPVREVRSELACLTSAERAVLEDLLAGHMNAAIAVRRRTSPRTVSKQVDSIYKKLGVHSRGELAARFG